MQAPWAFAEEVGVCRHFVIHKSTNVSNTTEMEMEYPSLDDSAAVSLKETRWKTHNGYIKETRLTVTSRRRD